jgi:hypothetical protein
MTIDKARLLGATVFPIAGNQVNILYDRPPDVCPICHHSTQPILRSGALQGSPVGGRVQLFYQCTKQGCESSFIGTYMHRIFDGSLPQGYYQLDSVAPLVPQVAVFSEVINELSPMFTVIYNQSMAAEAGGLDQLTGIGLRKALEFLVKDFAVGDNPANEETIRKTALGNCIKTYLTDPNVRACADRAVWLGNDETHYTRKWQTKDINDLKLLTKLTVNWIEIVLLTKHYTDSMPAGQ